jgi:hypothetical protein
VSFRAAKAADNNKHATRAHRAGSEYLILHFLRAARVPQAAVL